MFSFQQVLRWAVRRAASSLLIPLHLRRWHLQPQCVGCGLFCSSSSQSTVLCTQQNYKISNVSEKPVKELSLQSLVDMGFTESQAEQVYESLSRVRGGNAAKNALSTLTVLFVLGFNPSSVLRLLQKCPELYTVKESQLQQRIGNLRKLGLVEGESISVQHILSYNC